MKGMSKPWDYLIEMRRKEGEGEDKLTGPRGGRELNALKRAVQANPKDRGMVSKYYRALINIRDTRTARGLLMHESAINLNDLKRELNAYSKSKGNSYIYINFGAHPVSEPLIRNSLRSIGRMEVWDKNSDKTSPHPGYYGQISVLTDIHHGVVRVRYTVSSKGLALDVIYDITEAIAHVVEPNLKRLSSPRSGMHEWRHGSL